MFFTVSVWIGGGVNAQYKFASIQYENPIVNAPYLYVLAVMGKVSR